MPEKVITIGGKDYFYDADKDEYYTIIDGDEKEYVGTDVVKADAAEKGTITVDGKEYRYDNDNGEWYPVGGDGDEEESGLTFEEVIGGGNTSEDVDN